MTSSQSGRSFAVTKHFHLPDKDSSAAMHALLARLKKRRPVCNKPACLAAQTSRLSLHNPLGEADTFSADCNGLPVSYDKFDQDDASQSSTQQLAAPNTPPTRRVNDTGVSGGCAVSDDGAAMQRTCPPLKHHHIAGCRHSDRVWTYFPPRCDSAPPMQYNMASALRPCPKPGYGLADDNFRSVHCTGRHSHIPPTSYVRRDFSRDSALYGNVYSGNVGDSLETVSADDSDTLFREPGSGGVCDSEKWHTWCESAVAGLSLPRGHPHSLFYRRSRQTAPRDAAQAGRYSFEQLRTDTGRQLPHNVHVTSLECYLSDDEFSEVFDMDRASFYQMPLWRRNQLKRSVHLY